MASIVKRYGGKVDPALKGKSRTVGAGRNKTHVYYGATFSSKPAASKAGKECKHLGANNARVFKSKKGWDLWVND